MGPDPLGSARCVSLQPHYHLIFPGAIFGESSPPILGRFRGWIFPFIYARSGRVRRNITRLVRLTQPRVYVI